VQLLVRLQDREKKGGGRKSKISNDIWQKIKSFIEPLSIIQ